VPRRSADDWIDEDNPVRVIDVFVDELDLGALDFGGVDPKATGRPSYHPSILLKLYVKCNLPHIALVIRECQIDAMTTDEALEGITDEGAFELLITAILGLAEPEYQRLIHVGINAQGKTIRSPVDGIVPAGADQKFAVTAFTTTTKAKLRGKWLSPWIGDVPKGLAALNTARAGDNTPAAVLILGTNRVPDAELITEIGHICREAGVELEIFERSRIARFLDFTAEGQYLRRKFLGVRAERLSVKLLKSLDPEAGVGRAPAHHAVGVDAVHRLVGEHGRGGLAVLADAGRGEILIEELFELVMRRHFVALAAFLVKAHPPALAARVIVLDPHGNDGRVVAAVACGFTPRSVRGVAAGAEPEVRIHLPPAKSQERTVPCDDVARSASESGAKS
jgi:hypothetical protein